MAERMLVAFGRYLRMLRERRGLSLDEVEALTRAYPEPVNKAYLSRVENGKSRIAFSRMVALCRAYEYPIDAAAERLALDLAVDKVRNPPNTEGRTVKELLEEARSHLRSGAKYHSYACARDSLAISRTSPLSESCASPSEQYGLCLLNTTTMAQKLGRFRFALQDLRHLEAASILSPPHGVLLLDRIANVLWSLGQLDEAAKYADRAIGLGSQEPQNEFLSSFYCTAALIAYSAGDKRRATELFRRSLRISRDTGAEADTANVLMNLAQTHFDVGRDGAARREAEAADRIAQKFGFRGISVRARILLGEILERSDDLVGAERAWAEGLRTAKSIGDASYLFKLQFFLYRNALRNGKPAIAKRLEKSLLRLAPWVPESTDELREFRNQLALKGRTVASSALPVGNGEHKPKETVSSPTY